MYIPTEDEFKGALDAFRTRELRGPVYFDAIREIEAGWGDAAAMARGAGLLLISWHNVFYRFGRYDEARFTAAIQNAMPVFEGLRHRDIASFGALDEDALSELFVDFTRALRGGRGRERASTVATAKALHLLAPGLLPLWDNSIAWAYGQLPMLAGNYLAFCYQMQKMARNIGAYVPRPDDRTVLKRIDEFNYAVHTKYWVRVQAGRS